MLNMCEEFVQEHKLRFSTDPRSNKCKTKCLAFLYKKRELPSGQCPSSSCVLTIYPAEWTGTSILAKMWWTCTTFYNLRRLMLLMNKTSEDQISVNHFKSLEYQKIPFVNKITDVKCKQLDVDGFETEELADVLTFLCPYLRHPSFHLLFLLEVFPRPYCSSQIKLLL